eukprot:2666215-Amphidinium_carterae.1
MGQPAQIHTVIENYKRALPAQGFSRLKRHRASSTNLIEHMQAPTTEDCADPRSNSSSFSRKRFTTGLGASHARSPPCGRDQLISVLARHHYHSAQGGGLDCQRLKS